MTLLFLVPTWGVSTSMGKFCGHLKTYLHILTLDQFSMYLTLQTYLTCKPFKISMQTLIHTFILPTLLTLSLPKPLVPPLSLRFTISQLFYWLSYFTTTYFVMPLSGYRTLTSPIDSNISTSILSLILYQLVGNFTFYSLMQPILDNASLLINIPFTSIKNLTKRAYPLTNPLAFTLPLTFP